MKGKKSHNDFGVPQKHSENIPFLSFLQEDFLPKQVQKDARSKIVLDIKEVLIHASAQYKTLLELPLLSFWSTVAHNSYILRSLDSFLCFARRGHFGVVEVPAPDERAAGQIFDIEEQQYKKGLDLYYNELYRVVLNIFLRLSSDPLSGASENIDYAHVIYHNWLFDIPKLLDLCSIYQNGNEEIIQKIIQNVFKVESAYKDDFLELVKELTDKVLPDNLKTLNRHRKREDLDVGLLKADTDEKEKILIFLYDIVENLGFIISMFPKTCRDDLFLDKKFLMVMESAYMNINSARKQWRIQEEKRDVLKALAKKIENDIIFIIETLFNHVFGDVFAKNPSEKVIKNKKAWTQFHHYMNATGKTNLAKKDDEPNFKFLRKLMKNVDFGGLLQKYPDIHIVKEADLENHQVIVMLQNERIEELINRKRALENKEDTATEPSEKPSVNSSPVRDQSLKSSPVKEQPKIEQIPIKKEDIPFRTKEEEGTREAIRIIEMHIGKKDKTKGAFDEDQIREAMKVTLRYAQQNNVYDDEYDDTLEMYEGDRLKVRGDRVEEEDDSDAEEANVEGELDKDEKPRGGPGQGRGGKARHLGGTRKEFEKRSGEKDTRGEYKGGNRGGYHDRNEGERRENKPYAGDGGYKRDYQQGGGYGRDNQQGGGYGRDNQQGGGYYKDRNYDRDNQQGGGYGRDNQQGGGYYKDRNYDNQQGGGYGRDNQQGGGYYKDRSYGGDSRGGYKYEKKEDTREQGQGQGQSQELGQGQGQGAPHVKGFGAGPAGQYDPKKSNRRAFQDRKHYKDTHGKKEYTPKDK